MVTSNVAGELLRGSYNTWCSRPPALKKKEKEEEKAYDSHTIKRKLKEWSKLSFVEPTSEMSYYYLNYRLLKAECNEDIK